MTVGQHSQYTSSNFRIDLRYKYSPGVQPSVTEEPSKEFDFSWQTGGPEEHNVSLLLGVLLEKPVSSTCAERFSLHAGKHTSVWVI